METTSIPQFLLNESFGLKRLLDLVDDYARSRITSALEYATRVSKEGVQFNENELRSDQVFILTLLHSLVTQNHALCSLITMSFNLFDPLPKDEIIPWLTSSCQFPKEDLTTAIKFAQKMLESKVNLPHSLMGIILEIAKGIVEENDLKETLKSVTSGAIDESKQQLLLDAIHADSSEYVEKAVSEGANVHGFLQRGLKPLHIAVINECLNAAGTLLTKCHAKVDARNTFNQTALELAVENRNLSAITLLLENGANLHAHNSKGLTVFHLAAQKGYLDVIELLVNGNLVPDLNFKDNQGNTPLHWASANGHIDVVQFLQAKGASVNTASKQGWTPLHAASEYNHTPIASFLISKDANINAKGDGGCTPLHLAADKGHIEVVKLLVAHDADHNASDVHFNRPIDLAKNSEHGGVEEFLMSLQE